MGCCASATVQDSKPGKKLGSIDEVSEMPNSAADDLLKWEKIGKMKFKKGLLLQVLYALRCQANKTDIGCSFGPPIVYGNELLFMSSQNNNLIVKSYDLQTNEYKEKFSIPTEIAFDIEECEYTLNIQSQCIQLMLYNDDQQFMSVDLQTESISFNGSNTTERDNTAHIAYDQKTAQTYIVGGHNADDSKNENNNFVYVPYDKCSFVDKQNKEYLIKKFGDCARTVLVEKDSKFFIFVMGGTTESRGMIVPTDVIWKVDLGDSDPSTKWECKYLYRKMTDFGVINYRNEYIITFGGIRWHKKKGYIEDDGINVLDLKKEKWIVLKRRLPKKSAYFALYLGNDIVHLFRYNGKHYTIEIDDIISATKEAENDDRLTLSWTEQGKTTVPSKSMSVKNKGPKITEDDSNSDDDDEDEDDKPNAKQILVISFECVWFFVVLACSTTMMFAKFFC